MSQKRTIAEKKKRILERKVETEKFSCTDEFTENPLELKTVTGCGTCEGYWKMLLRALNLFKSH